MSTTIPAYHEIIDLIAGGTTPEQVINFRPSPQAQGLRSTSRFVRSTTAWL
jgi:hypothetical protein